METCILTENEKAKGQLRDKEQKKKDREEKKRIQLEKKKEREEKKRKESSGSAGKKKKRKVVEEPETTDEEEIAGVVCLPLSAMVEDSSEYSDELPNDLEIEGSYPFAQKEPAVRDFP